jgi:uncharacterized protein YndB with AHSA1/START domain
MDPQPTARVVSDRAFSVHHTFRAPAARVFAAYVEPELVARWWAPPGGSLRVETLEARAGGAYRYVQRTGNGQEVVFAGTFLEVVPVTRLVYTFQMEGWPDSRVTTTIVLAEAAGSTKLTLTNEYPTKDVRDAMAQHGAVAGAKASLEKLAEVLHA